MRAISYIERNPHCSIAEISRIFSINPRTLAKIYKKYRRDGSLSDRQRGGAVYRKILDIHKSAIEEWLEINPILTLVQIKEKLMDNFNLQVTAKTISRTLVALNLTYKLVRLVPASRNNAVNIEARYIYAASYFDRIPFFTPDVIYIDETGFNLHVRRRYGRSQRGQRAEVVVANSRGRNISVCAAMTNQGLVHFKALLGSYNTTEFVIFIQDLVTRLPIGPKIMIMDNVRFHHAASVRDVVESMGHEIFFVPPYSPQLNPIELLFSKWKSIIKRQVSVFDTRRLLEVINTAAGEISSHDCSGWVRESTRYASIALQRENI